MQEQSVEQQTALLEKWLNFSKVFYDAFPIDRYQGLQWFFIEVLVHDYGRRMSVGQLKETVSNLKLIDNANYYVPALLENLRSHKFVQLIDSEDNKIDAPFSESDKHYILLSDQFLNAVSKYVASVFQVVLGEAPALSSEAARKAMVGIYDFFMSDYLPLWRKLLRDIARIATAKSDEVAKSLEAKLRDDSVVYVLIHSFWSNFISEKNHPVFFTRAVHFAERIRVYEPETMLIDCLNLLASSNILKRDGAGKRATYALNPIFEQRLRQYTADLFECTRRFGNELRNLQNKPSH